MTANFYHCTIIVVYSCIKILVLNGFNIITSISLEEGQPKTVIGVFNFFSSRYPSNTQLLGLFLGSYSSNTSGDFCNLIWYLGFLLILISKITFLPIPSHVIRTFSGQFIHKKSMVCKKMFFKI